MVCSVRGGQRLIFAGGWEKLAAGGIEIMLNPSGDQIQEQVRQNDNESGTLILVTQFEVRGSVKSEAGNVQLKQAGDSARASKESCVIYPSSGGFPRAGCTRVQEYKLILVRRTRTFGGV